jgi:hypothetical protein
MTPEGAYLLRRHAEGASFRAAWEAALALGIQQLEDIAMERALYGQEVPVYSYGKLIGSRVVHNDRLLMFMLRNRAPTRFTADGRAAARQNTIGDPAQATQLSRRKKQWRKEWEEEQREAGEADSAAVIARINTKLERSHQNYVAAMTRRTRALYEAFKAAEREDEAQGRYSFNEDDDADEAELLRLTHGADDAAGGEDPAAHDPGARPGQPPSLAWQDYTDPPTPENEAQAP